MATLKHIYPSNKQYSYKICTNIKKLSFEFMWHIILCPIFYSVFVTKHRSPDTSALQWSIVKMDKCHHTENDKEDIFCRASRTALSVYWLISYNKGSVSPSGTVTRPYENTAMHRGVLSPQQFMSPYTLLPSSGMGFSPLIYREILPVGCSPMSLLMSLS